MKINFVPNTSGTPTGKLADAELCFTDGPLSGLRLIGFGIWHKRGQGGVNVTYPSRQYTVNGEKRTFALLRPMVEADAQKRLTDQIVAAWDASQK